MSDGYFDNDKYFWLTYAEREYINNQQSFLIFFCFKIEILIKALKILRQTIIMNDREDLEEFVTIQSQSQKNMKEKQFLPYS